MGAENAAGDSNTASSGAVAGPERIAAAAGRRDGLAAGPLAGLLVALAAGAVCWVLLETAFPVFTVSEDLIPGAFPSDEEMLAFEVALGEAVFRNAILFVGIFGAVVGGGLAVGEGVAQRSRRIVLKAALAGTAVAAVFGCLAALTGHVAFDYHYPIEGLSPLAKTIRTQAAMLATLGAGIGLAVGIFSGGRRIGFTCVVGGLLAGVLAGMVYPMVTAVCFPGIATELVVPYGTVDRFLWIGVMTGLAGVIIPGVGRRRPPRKDRLAAEQPPA